MPGFDETGPEGLGPMTGGGFGYCSGNNPENQSPAPRNFVRRGGFNRRTQGMGGRGRGHRFRFFQTGVPGYTAYQQSAVQRQDTNKEAEISSLKQQMGSLEAALKQIKDKLKELIPKEE